MSVPIDRYEITDDHFYLSAKKGLLENIPPMSAKLTLEYMKIFEWPPRTAICEPLGRQIAVYNEVEESVCIIVPNIRKQAETREEFNKMMCERYEPRVRILKSEIDTKYPWFKCLNEKYWNTVYTE
jgi:hypothetical protein